MKGYTQGFTLQDTTPFSLENIEQVQSAVFRINVTNGFPASAFTQVYFTDSLYNQLDSLISDPADLLVESGQLDLNGVVIAQHVQIYSTYKIEVRVGVRAQLSFQSN